MRELLPAQAAIKHFRHFCKGRVLDLPQTPCYCPCSHFYTISPKQPRHLAFIFDHFHNIAHAGRLASRRIVSSRFVWRGLSSNVTAWARGCLAYQQGKIHRCTCLAPKPIPIPQGRFTHLHVYLVGPLQYSNNFNYMEAIPLSDTSAAACAKVLTFTWISRFGVPETITSDHGTQFTSNLLFKLYKMLHISHKQTTVYHPESKGAVERLHHRLKDALCLRSEAVTWSKELPFVLLGL